MLKVISQFFTEQLTKVQPENDAVEREHAYRLASAALLIEMSRADFQVSQSERDAVTDAIRRTFDLGAAETEHLLELAAQEADSATSLYEFTRLINDHFDRGQKEHLVELMWQVAFADGHLDKYEEHLVRKVADLIHLPHVAFIHAKHRAKESSPPSQKGNALP